MKMTEEMSDEELLRFVEMIPTRTMADLIRDRDRCVKERNHYRDALTAIAKADEWSGGVWFRGVAQHALKG